MMEVDSASAVGLAEVDNLVDVVIVCKVEPTVLEANAAVVEGATGVDD